MPRSCPRPLEPLDRLSQARRLYDRGRILARRSGRAEAHLALVLSVMDRDRLWRALGYKNLNACARDIADWSASKTSRMVALVRDLQVLPEMSRRFYRGELPWTKVSVAAAEAAKDPGTDAQWCERVRQETRQSLERRARLAAGLPMLHDFITQLDDEQQAWLDDAFAVLQRERGESVTPAQVVGEACRRLVLGGVAGAGRRPIVAFGVCAKCDEATHGTVTRRAESVSALCDIDFVDFTTNPPTRGRSIPADEAARVIARDQARCRVPGCTNKAWIDIHHEGGVRNVGHDPEKMLLLCRSHHDARHEGALDIVFADGRAIFSLADGDVIGDVDLRVLPGPVHPKKRRGQEMLASPMNAALVASSTADTPSTTDFESADTANLSDAQRALVALGFGVREAATLIANEGPCTTTELLVREALRRRAASA